MNASGDDAILAELKGLGVRRLTHFTNTKNLPHILRADELMSTARLRQIGASYTPTDLDRFDDRLEYICCNLEFPNMYYFDQAKVRRNVINYSDWCVLLIDIEALSGADVLFSPVNAARGRGVHLAAGVEAVRSMYSPVVSGRRRGYNHWPASPTDVQAEVLVRDSMPMSAVSGIVVPDDESLRREVGRLSMIGLDIAGVRWFVGPGMFEKGAVTSAVRSSIDIPLRGPWVQSEELS